jgi:hypothetical protein
VRVRAGAPSFAGASCVVSGGAGFIGSNVAHRLVEAGARVSVVDRFVDGHGGDRRNLEGLDVQLLECDIGDPEVADALVDADVVFNVAGATRFAEDGVRVGRLVYFGTDPVYHEIAFANGDEEAQSIIEEHHDFVTYGENIGSADCPVPVPPRLRAKTRQAVLLDLWQAGPPSKKEFTTVGNWQQEGREVKYRGKSYHWSKHLEFLKFVDLPQRTNQPLELAMNLADAQTIKHGAGEVVRALGVTVDARHTLESNGWKLADTHALTTDPWPYRDYVQASRGEFTVARDLHVRLRSGWFSERSACYLASGRPVITQDTGFGTVLPTGVGLFAFNTMDEILAAIETINSDYEKHSRGARAIAEEYFKAETVLADVLYKLGL